MYAALRRARAGNNARTQCYAYCFISNRHAKTGDRRVPAHNSHFRQRFVIFGGYLESRAADLYQAALGTITAFVLEELIMIDQEIHRPFADRMARSPDVAQTIAAIIAKTRHEWTSQRPASVSPDETVVERTRPARPWLRLAQGGRRWSA